MSKELEEVQVKKKEKRVLEGKSAELERFLRARVDNVKKAAKNLRAVLSWWEIIGADHIIAAEFSSELSAGMAYVAGHDDENHPVVVRLHGRTQAISCSWTAGSPKAL